MLKCNLQKKIKVDNSSIIKTNSMNYITRNIGRNYCSPAREGVTSWHVIFLAVHQLPHSLRQFSIHELR